MPRQPIWGHEGTVPEAAIRVRQCEGVARRFVDGPLTVLWYWVRVANGMDGIAGLTQHPVEPGEAFLCDFTVCGAGTLGSDLIGRGGRQRGNGFYSVLIVAEAEAPEMGDDEVLLHDDLPLLASGTRWERYGSASETVHGGTDGARITVNDHPEWNREVGENGRLRIRHLNVCEAQTFTLGACHLKCWHVAHDGQALESIEPSDRVDLAPGQRFALTVDITAKPGTGGLLFGDEEPGSRMLAAFVATGVARLEPRVRSGRLGLNPIPRLTIQPWARDAHLRIAGGTKEAGMCDPTAQRLATRTCTGISPPEADAQEGSYRTNIFLASPKPHRAGGTKDDEAHRLEAFTAPSECRSPDARRRGLPWHLQRLGRNLRGFRLLQRATNWELGMSLRWNCRKEAARRRVVIRRGIWKRLPSIAILALLLTPSAAVLGHRAPKPIPLVPAASNSTQQGFIRVVNRTNRAGSVSILAIDDDGARFGPVSIALRAKAVAHFNSDDLERGNASKGLPDGVGDGKGNWRLELSSDLDFEALAYIRTGTGFVTTMHDIVAEDTEGRHRVPIFNPGSNLRQQSRLRLINPGPSDTEVTITGFDDDGVPPPAGDVRLNLPAGEARLLTAEDLESGDDELTGRLGDGAGKWTLFVSAPHSIQVMSLLLSEDGNLSNLSRSPYETHQTEGETPEDCDDELVVEGRDSGHGSFDRAVSLGDLTKVATVGARAGTVNRAASENGYYRFALDDTRTIRLELRDLTRNADLYLLDSVGENYHNGKYHYSTNEGFFDESIASTIDAGIYFIWVQAIESGAVGYQLRYSNDSEVPGRKRESAFKLGDLTEIAAVRITEGQINATRNETCHFHRAYYRLSLADTRTIRVELRDLTRNADLYLLDSVGENYHNGKYHYSTNEGSLGELIESTLDAGIYYILVEAATTSTSDTGYELRYSNDSEVPGRRRESAFELGDLTYTTTTRARSGKINATRNETEFFRRAYYRFTLGDTRTIRVELRNLTRNADLYLLDSVGENYHNGKYHYSTNEGNFDESIVATLDAGTYYILVEAATTSTTDIGYALRYGP